MAGTRDRDVAHAIIKKLFRFSGVRVYQNPVNGLTLRRMACDSISVIDVSICSWIKRYLAPIVESYRQFVVFDFVEGPKFAISDSFFHEGRSELKAIPLRELSD